MNDHYWCIRLGVEWFICRSKMAIYKRGDSKRMCSDRSNTMIGQIGHVAHYLGSLLHAIESTIMSAFVCRVGHFDTGIKETLLYR